LKTGRWFSFLLSLSRFSFLLSIRPPSKNVVDAGSFQCSTFAPADRRHGSFSLPFFFSPLFFFQKSPASRDETSRMDLGWVTVAASRSGRHFFPFPLSSFLYPFLIPLPSPLCTNWTATAATVTQAKIHARLVVITASFFLPFPPFPPFSLAYWKGRRTPAAILQSSYDLPAAERLSFPPLLSSPPFLFFFFWGGALRDDD